jgi:DNA primase
MHEWVSFSEIKNRVTLERVLRSYRVDWLRRSGLQQYRGRCPIHQGQGVEAFHANLGRGVFHCFACGAGGNVLDFVAAMDGCSLREAALRLQAAHRDDHGSAPWVAACSPEARKLVTKKREVNPPLQFSLALDPAHLYLVERGIEMGTASYFGVGYFRGRGLMNGRIAIPIHDDEGRLVAYCGRALDGATPRYRFPAGFEKSQVLFNHHRARATGDDQVIVVEGFFDCMRVHQAGFGCVVALMGARLSRTQKSFLIGQYRKVTLMLDGDPTGRSATAQIASDLAPAMSVTELLLAPGVQPDQMTSEQIRQVLKGRRNEVSIPRELTAS